MRRPIHYLVIAAAFLALPVLAHAELLDELDIGNKQSEEAHRVSTINTRAFGPDVEGAGIEKLSASTSQGDNVPARTLDGRFGRESRWAANGKGQWIQYTLTEPIELDQLSIVWHKDWLYNFAIKTSMDGDQWTTVFKGKNRRKGPETYETFEFDSTRARHIRIVGYGGSRGNWVTFSEIKIPSIEKPVGYAPSPSEPGLEKSSRALMPHRPEPRRSGGALTFTLDCDPDRQNYLTLKFWGGEQTYGNLHLFHGKKQISALSSKDGWPALDGFNKTPRSPFPERFWYSTYPIPRKLTRGQESVRLRVVSFGSWYNYAPNYKKAQNLQRQPSRRIYHAYSHTGGFFEPPADEKQGQDPGLAPLRPAPEDRTVMEQLAREADSSINENNDDPAHIGALSRAYLSEWSKFYQDKEALLHVREVLDEYVRRQASQDGALDKLGWGGHGDLAYALHPVLDAFEKQGWFDEKIDHDGDTGTPRVTRYKAYVDFFSTGLQWRARDRRGLTANQVLHVTTGLIRMHALLKDMKPEASVSDETAMRWVHEALGMKPATNEKWMRRGAQIGFPWYVISPEGLSTEPMWATDYGEISSGLADLVELVNDPAVRRRAIECARARTVFRQFHWDKDGYRGLRTEGVIGTRHNNYPGRLRYGKRPLFVAATLNEPVTLRIAQLYLKHNRPFDEYEGRKTPLKRVMAVNAYREIADRPPSDYRLPTRPGQGDFLLTDEQVNAVAVRHDDRTLYAVLNWHNQKSGGINNIARIHYTTPRVDRIANVRMKTKYWASGEHYTKRDVVGIDHPHNPQHAKNPESYRLPWGTTEAHRVLAGMKLPIATGPGGQSLSDRDPRKMTGTFLRLRYGDYLIGMNRTRGEHGKTYTIEVPQDVPRAKDLASGETYQPGSTVEVSPDSTAVLYLGN